VTQIDPCIMVLVVREQVHTDCDTGLPFLRPTTTSSSGRQLTKTDTTRTRIRYFKFDAKSRLKIKFIGLLVVKKMPNYS
jgi:hypothetical protein